MQSGKYLRDLWPQVEDERFNVQGKFSDYLLDCIKDGKTLDIKTAPVQTLNYYFAQSIFLSLRTRVSQCHSIEQLNDQLRELTSEASVQELIEAFITSSETRHLIAETQKSAHPLTTELAREQIKPGIVLCYLRLYYKLEKAACVARQLNAADKRGGLLAPEAFERAVTSQMQQCREILGHLASDTMVSYRQSMVDPIVEFNQHLVRVLESKKVCQILIREMLTLPPDVRVDEACSFVKKYPELAAVTSLDDIGVMIAGMANEQRPAPGWQQVKSSYAAAVRVLQEEIKENVLVQSVRDAALYQENHHKLMLRKATIADAKALVELGDLLMQFHQQTSVYEFQNLGAELAQHCKAISTEPSTIGRFSAKLNQAVDGFASKFNGKRTSQRESAAEVISKTIDHFLASVDTAKKPYEDALVQYEIYNKLRHAQDSFQLAEDLLTQWQAANAQLAFITDTALEKLREMIERFEDIEKQPPNMVLDFLKRRWPEMSISFGSVGTVGGFGTVLLSIFAGISFPAVVTVTMVVAAATSAALIVPAVKDIVAPPKTEKEEALASLNALLEGEVQRVEQPVDIPSGVGRFARLFGRSTPPFSAKRVSGLECSQSVMM